MGTTLREAARRSGYAHGQTNKGFLSRLSKKPEIAARIEEIKRDRAIAFHESGAGERFHSGASLKDLGLTEDWVLQAYLAIHAAAMEAGSYPSANVAMKGVEALIRKRDEALANGGGGPAQVEDQKIEPAALILFLKDLRGVLGAPEDTVAHEGPSDSRARLLRHRHDK